MWEFINVLLLLAGVVLAVLSLKGVFRRRKLMGAFIFIALTFVLNLAIYIVPYIYSIVVAGKDTNAIYGVWECISNAVKHFFGEVTTSAVLDYAKDHSLYAFTFSTGAVLAMAAMISTALMFFRVKIRNYLRLSAALKAPDCDIVVGTGDAALTYARNNKNVVVMPYSSDACTDETELMEEGYAVIETSFSKRFLESHYLNTSTRYNFIIIDQNNKFINYINTFISYSDSAKERKNIYLYIETDNSAIDIMRREVLENNKYRRYITLFSRNELLARELAEKHPVTQYLPKEFMDEDTSVKADKKINVVIAGFGELNKEVYRQFVMNNQLVTYKNNEYCAFPLNYYIYDDNARFDIWDIEGVQNALIRLENEKDSYFPLPELPCNTQCIKEAPGGQAALKEITGIISDKDAFTYVIIDVGDVYKNIEIMSRLRFLAGDVTNYKIVLRCESGIMEGISDGICYGDIDTIFTHDVIVNESLSIIAKKVNEIYVKMSVDIPEDDPKYKDIVQEKSVKSWEESTYFNICSNIYSALNLRLKLHLLGLDYVSDGKGENYNLIEKKYIFGIKCENIDEYFSKSTRNAMLAQEHLRWNAYHLLSEWRPMKKENIVVSDSLCLPPKFTTKDSAHKYHACLTTYAGLGELSAYLARNATDTGKGKFTPMNYDYCANDEMLILSAGDILSEAGFSVVERH